MVFIIFLIIIIAVAVLFIHQNKKPVEQQESELSVNNQQPTHFNLLDDNGDPIGAHKMKIVIDGGDSDAPIQELQYFCIKDKGYHVSVWPKDQSKLDIIEFNIAGMTHRDNIDNYLGEFEGILKAEPTNEYDPNAIKILATDGHHVGYVPRDTTDAIRNAVHLPCHCFCYIGTNNDTYFSE